jgi:hypothetical protein
VKLLLAVLLFGARFEVATVKRSPGAAAFVVREANVGSDMIGLEGACEVGPGLLPGFCQAAAPPLNFRSVYRALVVTVLNHSPDGRFRSNRG